MLMLSQTKYTLYYLLIILYEILYTLRLYNIYHICSRVQRQLCMKHEDKYDLNDNIIHYLLASLLEKVKIWLHFDYDHFYHGKLASLLEAQMSSVNRDKT